MNYECGLIRSISWAVIVSFTVTTMPTFTYAADPVVAAATRATPQTPAAPATTPAVGENAAPETNHSE